MTATDEMRQLSIRTDGHEVDVTLPAHVPIAELIPAVLDLLGEKDFVGSDPRFRRVSGETLDPAATLAQCGIPHGELLLLTSVATQPVTPPRFDTSATVVEFVAGLRQPSKLAAGHRAGRIVVCWCAAVVTALLGHAVLDVNATPAHPDHLGPPEFLLAMSATSAISLLAWRLLNCAPLVLLPVAAVAMAATSVTVGAVGGWWPITAAGPILAAASLATLTGSTRLSVRSSGLAVADLSDTELETRTVTAHRRLTLLVLTAAPAAALGTVITAATTDRTTSAAVFIAVVAAALVLRVWRRDDPHHVAVLLFSSGVAMTALIFLCAVTILSSTVWLCAGLVVVAAGAVWLPWRIPARVRRGVAMVDVAVSAAVVPCAATAAGAFAILPGIGQP